MNRRACVGLVLVVVAVLAAGVRAGGRPAPAVQAKTERAVGEARFAYVEVFVDSGEKALAAYQIELVAAAGSAPVQIVGIEGGEPAEFRGAPYYDAAAMASSRVIVAAFSTAEAGGLPVGRNRLARVHVRYTGDGMPAFSSLVQASSGPNGGQVPVKVELIVEEPK